MPSPTADPLIPVARQDWLAAAQTTMRKPIPPSPFESLLKPREPLPNPLAQESWTGSQFESTSAARAADAGPRNAETQATEQSGDSGTDSEAAGALPEQCAEELSAQDDTSAEEDSPSDVVQSLSGAAAIVSPVELAALAVAEPTVPSADDAAGAMLPVAAADAGATSASPTLEVTRSGAANPDQASSSRNALEGETPAAIRRDGAIELLAAPGEICTDASSADEDSAAADDTDQHHEQLPLREHRSDASQTLPFAATGADPKPVDLRPDQLNQPAESKGGPNSAPTPPISNTAAVDAPRIRLPAEVMVPAQATARPGAGVEIDAARLLHRVARAFAQAADRNGEVTIRLSPPELGALRLEVQVREGALTAHLQAETPEARTAILENLSALRERLSDQGVRIERFDVDLMNRQPGGSPQQAFSDQRESPRTWRPASEAAAIVKQPTAVPTTNKSSAGPGRLNVIV